MAKGDRFDEDQLKGLLEAIRDGDEAKRRTAVADLFDLIDRFLLGLLHQFRVDRQDLIDLQNTVMVKIMQGARGYDGGSPVSWIMRIARRVAIDHHRDLQSEAAAPMPEDEDHGPTDIAGPLVWDAWQGKGIVFMGPDLDQWSDGQLRLGLEACIEFHLRQLEADDPKRGTALRKAALEKLSMRALGALLGMNENYTRVFTRESRLKSASYFEECMQFVKGLADRRRKPGQGKGRA